MIDCLVPHSYPLFGRCTQPQVRAYRCPLLWRIFLSCPSAVWNESLECDFVLILGSFAPGSFLIFSPLHFVSQAVCVFGDRFTPASCVLQDLVTPGSTQERHWWGGRAGRSKGALGCFSYCSALGGISSRATSPCL